VSVEYAEKTGFPVGFSDNATIAACARIQLPKGKTEPCRIKKWRLGCELRKIWGLKWKSRLTIFARVRSERGCERRVIAWRTAKRYRPVVLLVLVATAWVFSYPLNAQELKASLPNLDLIVDSLERTEEQNPARSRPYEVTRQYKVFRGDDRKPSSEVTAQIGFTPPDIKTFKITEEQGSPRGKKVVSAILEQEIASAKAGHKGAISRSNYDFVFLREQNFGAVPEYVLHIIPKRKEKGLLLGDIWVDAKTYHIRQIVGVPVKSPSFWIKDVNITVQFADANGMWIPVSVDSIATVRFLGICTLTGRDLAPPIAASSAPSP
jgi:hypothetical protein